MERSWYRFRLHGKQILAPLTEERAAEMRARGVALEPASAPEDLVERLAPVVALLLGARRSWVGG